MALSAAMSMVGALSAELDTNAVVTAWLGAQKDLRSWSADFTQTRTLRTLTRPLVTTGHLWFAPPDRFRWELGQPARTIAVRSGELMHLVYPELKRAERYSFSTNTPAQWRDALALLQAGFPRDRKAFDAQFEVTSLRATTNGWEMGLQPKSAFARQMMPSLSVQFATNTYSLLATDVTFTDGSRMRSDFTNATINPVVDEGVFEWKPEPGYKISEPFAR